ILGGLVAITPCAFVVGPAGAFAVGLSAGIINNLGYDLILKKWRIDDAVGAIPIHGICGAWGTLCVALFARGDQFGTVLLDNRLEQLGVQAVGILACMLWAGSVSFVLFKFLRRYVGLRVSPEEEISGIQFGLRPSVQ
ncbi:MAG: ammonium transporter protein, partial [Verrucomicrobiota bacterium]